MHYNSKLYSWLEKELFLLSKQVLTTTGLSYKELSEKLGLPETTLRYMLYQNGWSVRVSCYIFEKLNVADDLSNKSKKRLEDEFNKGYQAGILAMGGRIEV